MAVETIEHTRRHVDMLVEHQPTMIYRTTVHKVVPLELVKERSNFSKEHMD